METKKGLFQTLLGSIQGVNNEGSAKRMTMFWVVVVLLTSMTATHEYCYYLAVISLNPTTVQIIVVKSFEPIHFSLQVTLWMFAGLATVESVTALIKMVKGGGNSEIKTEVKENGAS